MLNLVNSTLSYFTILGQILGLVLIILFLTQRKTENPLLDFISKNVFLIAFAVSFGSMALSLFYSEIAGFAPCALCWYQRIFMYPIAFIAPLAWLKKDETAVRYIFMLSLIGLLIAAYHTLLQFGITPNLPCAAEGVSCAQRFVLSFGYITIPIMSITAFTIVLISSAIRIFHK